MNETTLQIVISLINDATAQLDEVSAQLGMLGTSASEAAGQITSSLTDAESAAADAAVAAAQQWQGAGAEISTAVETAATSAEGAFKAIPDSALAAANASSESWQASLSELQTMMADTTAATEADFAAMGEAAKTTASTNTNVFGYFHNFIAGMFLQRGGSMMTGAVQATVGAAAGIPNQVAQLTAAINQQRAAIGVNEAELLRWNGTTAQVSAAHVKARADIAAETVKIAELTRQLQPLQAAQEQVGNSAQKYNQAVQSLSTHWNVLLATIGHPFITATTGQIKAIQKVVDEMQKWAQAHPQLMKEILTFIAILGPLLTILGTVTIAWALFDLVLGASLGPFLLIGAAIAVVIAAVVAFWPHIKQLFDYLNNKYHIVETLKNAWHHLSTDFETKLLPDLKLLWIHLQPLMPYLKDLAGFVGGMLVMAFIGLADALIKGVDGFIQIFDWATKLVNFIIGHLTPAINTIKNLFGQIAGSSAGHGSSAASSSLVTTALSTLFASAIPGFATGGVVNGPTLAMVGEAGPEAIIPLSAFAGGQKLAGAGAGGGAGGINVYIQGGTYLDKGGADMIAQSLATQIGRQLKLKNFL